MTGPEDMASWFVGGTECYRRSLELIARVVEEPEAFAAPALVGAAQTYATLALAHATAETGIELQRLFKERRR